MGEPVDNGVELVLVDDISNGGRDAMKNKRKPEEARRKGQAGFNEWAEANAIVIIYPAMSQWGRTGQSRGGCWDGYAQTGSDYGLQSGAQVSVVRNLIKIVAGV